MKPEATNDPRGTNAPVMPMNWDHFDRLPVEIKELTWYSDGGFVPREGSERHGVEKLRAVFRRADDIAVATNYGLDHPRFRAAMNDWPTHE